jgi:hypothetical protein
VLWRLGDLEPGGSFDAVRGECLASSDNPAELLVSMGYDRN